MNWQAEQRATAGNRTWFVNLDATRFLGFFHVFLAHCFFSANPEIKESAAFQLLSTHLKSGFLGLDYFFVLSAFLLTWLALEEIQRTGSFHPLKFLVRRGLRLWPLYFLLVGLVYATASLLNGLEPLPPIRVFLLFYANLWIAEHGQNFLFLLVFFWSVSAEEQFYLLWAALIKISQRLIPWACVAMMATSLLFRWQFIEHNTMLSFHTFSILGNFGTGGLAAWLAFCVPGFQAHFIGMPRTRIIIVYVALLLLTVFYFQLFSGSLGTLIEKQLFALFFAFIILEQCFSRHSFIKFGKFKTFNYLGRISLGLYCYHGIVLSLAVWWLPEIGLANTPAQVFFLNPLLILLVTLIVAILSYELFEKRLHAMRKYFYPEKR